MDIIGIISYVRCFLFENWILKNGFRISKQIRSNVENNKLIEENIFTFRLVDCDFSGF